jgi:hypothetical protein
MLQKPKGNRAGITRPRSQTHQLLLRSEFVLGKTLCLRRIVLMDIVADHKKSKATGFRVIFIRKIGILACYTYMAT